MPAIIKKNVVYAGAEIVDLEWKLLGNMNGTTQLALPNNYKELLVYVNRGNSGYYLTFNIIKKCLSSADKYFTEGFYYSATNNARCVVCANTNRLYLYEMTFNDTDMVSSSTTEVYYR